MDIHVAHIGCQPWKPGIDILSVPIPGQQPINRKSVAKVMDAWADGLGVMDAALPQQVPEGLVDGALVQALGSLVEEERRVGGAWHPFQPFVHILLQRPAGGSTQRHPASLSELAFGSVDAPLRAVEVFQVQGQCFTDPDSRGV
jgi:hypothetical protein